VTDRDLIAWTDTLGRVEPARTADSIQSWLDAGEERPEWELWGKAQPDSPCPAHPLLCHMIDVSAVAARMVTSILPSGLRQRLLAIHPDPAKSFSLLLFVVALHDLGKALTPFQVKVPWAKQALASLGYDLNPQNNRHHGDGGLLLVYEALESRGASRSTGLSLARAVTAHHGQFPTNAGNLGRKGPGPRERGKNERWADARDGITRTLTELFEVDFDLSDFDGVSHADVLLVAGLTSVADWLGSMSEVFVYEAAPPSGAGYWRRALQRADDVLERAGFRTPSERAEASFEALFPGYEPWPLHRVVMGFASKMSAPSLTVVEAPMGEGKTEAALLLAEAASAKLGLHGLYIGLPTQATSNQMFRRLESFLKTTRPDSPSNLLLAHGEASLVEPFSRLMPREVYGRDDDEPGVVRAEGWFLRAKRKLLGDFGVGTIDQALLGVLRTPHAFVRLFGLAGKTVVFDEVHAYDHYTGELLLRLIEWLAALGSNVVLLSATLPPVLREQLTTAYERGAGLDHREPTLVPYPRVTQVSAAGRSENSFGSRGAALEIALSRQAPDLEALAKRVVEEARRGGCVALICNTVARAQDATRLVRQLAPEIPWLLLHARLLPDERLRREQQLENWLGPEHRAEARPEACIVIGTQVLEQSLDVDFDVMFSDLAPIDLLLQRMGRMHRHERENRAPGRARAEFILVQPDGDWWQTDLQEVARVYDEVIIRLTLRELLDRDQITLPDDIPTLVDSVYDPAAAQTYEALLAAAYERREDERRQRGVADVRLMPGPDSPDDPFAALTCWMKDEEDPLVRAQMRAMTRMAPPSVSVVCVDQVGADLFVGDGDTEPLRLDQVPSRALVARLARRTLKISTASIVTVLANDPAAQPAGWQKSSILRHRRLLPFVNSQATVAGCILHLDDELGLVITYPRKGGAAS